VSGTGAEGRRTVVHYLDGRLVGGAERIAISITDGLDRGRWRPVIVAHPEAATAIRARLRPDVPLRIVDRPRGPWDLPRVARLVRTFRRLRPAVIHIHRSWALSAGAGAVAAALARSPAVVSTEHLWLPTTPRRATLVRSIIDLGVDRQVAVSAGVARQMRERLWISRDRLEVIENGIDVEAYTSRPTADLRAALLGPRSGPIILEAARLDPQKGQEVLLRASLELPGVVIVLAGVGPDRQRLEHLATELGVADRVRFVGLRDDIPDLLRAADVVVLPSRAEGLPVLLLEALAAGVPAVASDIPGNREALGEGTAGRLVPTGDPAALAGAIRSVLDDTDDRRRMVEAGRALVARRFGSQRMVGQVESVYDAVLDGDRQRRPRPSPIDPAEPSAANEALRRVDWRFLVRGGPRFRRAIVAGDARLIDSVRRIADEVAPAPARGDDGVASPDLVVLLDPAPYALEQAVSRVGGQASIVVEHDAPLKARLRGRAVPWGVARRWVAWKDERRPSAYLPLDDGVARRRWLRDRLGGGSIARRAAGFGRAIAFETRLAAGLGPRRIAVVDRPTEPDPWASLLREHWPARDRPAPDRPTWTLIVPGQRTTGKVVALVARPRARPSLVVKSPRTARGGQGLQREAAVLDALGTLRPGLAGRVPALLATCDGPDGPALLESCVPGHPLGRMLSPTTFRDLGRSVVAALVELVDPLGTEPPRAPADPVIDRFRALADGLVDPHLLEESLAAVREVALPAAIEHRDPGPWNLLLAGERIHLLDWESAALDGVAGPDAWYALVYLQMGCRGIRERDLVGAYREHHGSEAGAGADAGAMMRSYADRVGIAPDALPTVRMLTWMLHLPSEADRLEPGAALSGATFLALWSVEARAAVGRR
jgi:glycosyltransferase involved in cell wall biosynthesis